MVDGKTIEQLTARVEQLEKNLGELQQQMKQLLDLRDAASSQAFQLFLKKYKEEDLQS